MEKKKSNNWVWAFVGIGIAAVLVKKPAVTTAINADINNGPTTPGTTVASYWQAPYYQAAPAGSLILTSDAAAQMAASIYNVVTDSFQSNSSVISIIQQLETKSQVSFLADKFQQLYSQALQAFLSKNLSASQWAAIQATTDKLPAYNA